MENYIDCKKKLYNTILEFLDDSEQSIQEYFEEFCKSLRIFNIEGDREEMTQFLLTIKNISDHYHRDKNFIQKIQKILQNYQAQIKQILSEEEIYYIFESNKLIILFLLQNGIINISESIYNDMYYKNKLNCNRYCHFFYPELERFKGEEAMKTIKEELLAYSPNVFENFESKRQEGENESHICLLIRKDSVEEFISYITRNKISVSSEITPSIFETNSFLIENEQTTLIEYSAFFGSIQIFRYLLMNDVELKPSLWLYSIHSKNGELIHLLESNKIEPPKFKNNKSKEKSKEKEANYLSCLIESIKCHHKDFSEYIINNLMLEQEIESTEMQEEIVFNSMKYHNYSFFKTDLIKGEGFFYLCLYNYKTLFELLLNEKEEIIKKKIIF